MKPGKSKKPLRLLVILEMGRLFPSGFLRGLIFKERFSRAGYTTKFVSHKYTGPVFWHIFPPFRLYTYLNELRLVYLARFCDVVYMCKVQSLRLVSLLRARTKAKLVLDFGDAVWLPRFENPEFGKVLALLDEVTTDNELTAAYVRQFNAHCTVMPDSPQIEKFDGLRAAIRKNAGGPVVIGWVGSQSTAYNLYVVWEALERIFIKHPDIQMRLLGIGKDALLLPPFEQVRYSCLEKYTQEEMIREVLKMDIGLFPLQDVEASRVRGVLKATVYMSGEAAVICSPVGQSVELIKDGVNGMLAASTDEWESKLEKLITDAGLRRMIAQAGLETVRAQFPLDKAFSILSKVLEGPKNG